MTEFCLSLCKGTFYSFIAGGQTLAEWYHPQPDWLKALTRSPILKMYFRHVLRCLERHWLLSLILACPFFHSAAWADDAAVSPPVAFDIPMQNAAGALTEFAQQANLTLIF